MSTIIIAANPIEKRLVDRSFVNYLDVAEFYCDTIQGEGVNMGIPAAFLRMQHCTSSCVWCDSSEVWRFGNPYLFDELYGQMEVVDLIRKFRLGQHLVLTGGSPLKQQFGLIFFLQGFIQRYGFKPYVEVENECVLMPRNELVELVDCWNNSPKLENSHNLRKLRYRPEVLRKMSSLSNSWFKFVISGDNVDMEWDEIVHDFLEPGIIKREQVILMPMGSTREELAVNREIVVELAVREGVRYSDRLHVIVWNHKTGV